MLNKCNFYRTLCASVLFVPAEEGYDSRADNNLIQDDLWESSPMTMHCNSRHCFFLKPQVSLSILFFIYLFSQHQHGVDLFSLVKNNSDMNKTNGSECRKVHVI